MRAQLWQKYNVTPLDTKWGDTDIAFEEESMQFRSRVVAPDLYA